MSQADSADLVVRDGISLARTMLGALHSAIMQMKPPTESTDEERSLRRWQIYLSILMLEVASAVADVAAEGYSRGAAILNRSVYEYATKLKYFSAHLEDAHKQFSTIPIRNFAMLAKAVPEERAALRISEAIDAWFIANPDSDEYSGNKNLLNMHLALQKPERILKDKRNPKILFTREHHMLHDIPSKVVHGEAAIMFDVFDDLDDATNFNASLRSGSFAVIREISKLITLLVDFLLVVHTNGTPIPGLENLTDQMIVFIARADQI